MAKYKYRNRDDIYFESLPDGRRVTAYRRNEEGAWEAVKTYGMPLSKIEVNPKFTLIEEEKEKPKKKGSAKETGSK
jgi:hypothetical protein